MICNYCPRHCNKDRSKSVGFCDCTEEYRVARAALHFWEEPCISGKNGSGAVFFSSCNLRCVYCQNYEISHQNKGVTVSEEKLISIFKKLISQGAENINLVNPTHFAAQIASTLSKWRSPVPIIYNCGGYDDANTIKMLDGLIDIYLPDLKYIRPDKAARYSCAPDYFSAASKALIEMRKQVKDTFDGDIMKSGMIIRHLILPQNTNSSIEILDWIKDNIPDTFVSLMAQYTPYGTLDDYPEINRKITKREYDKVVNYAIQNGFEKLYIQKRASADKKFIPAFDFTGVI